MVTSRGQSRWLVAAFSLEFFLVAGWLAAHKPFWTDELHVIHLAMLPSLSQMSTAMLMRPDAMPPLIYELTFWIGRITKLNEFTARLPPIGGVWLLCVSLFDFLRRRVSPLLAGVGMLLPTTVVFVYGYALETRGYGLLLGFAGAAVWCWDRAWTRRPLAYVGLAASIALAIASHLFAVLMLAPLALAELARSRERRRIDPWVWVSMAASGAVLLWLWPFLPNMVRIGRLMAGGHMSLNGLVTLWYVFLSTPLTYLGLALLIAAAAQLRGTSAISPPAIVASDYVLAIGFACLPLVGFIFGALVTGVVTPRYVLPAVIGLSVLIPLVCAGMSARSPWLGVLLFGWVAIASLATAFDVKRDMVETGAIARGRGVFALVPLAPRIPNDGRPIVVTDYHTFMALDYYVPATLRPRLVFIADYDAWILPDAPLHRSLYHEHMLSLREFLAQYHSFYLYDCDTVGRKSPLIADLVSLGDQLADTGLLDTANTFPRPGYLYLVNDAAAR